ncbi:MAG: hypothetical protein JNM98_06055 [Rhodocyclaceae bacterium]|nr:hypothetical protein [Rhodocyclaceae bacterium]
MAGKPSFARLAVGELVTYSIRTAAGIPIETGVGTWLGAGILDRTAVSETWVGVYSDANSPAVLSGTNYVEATISAGSVQPTRRGGYDDGTQADRVHFCGVPAAVVATTVAVSAANRVHYVPTLCNFGGLVAGISAKYGSVNVCDVGIYPALPSGLPGRLLWGWTGTATTTAQGILIFDGANVGAAPRRIQRIAPGWYFVGVNFAVANTAYNEGVRLWETPVPAPGHNASTGGHRVLMQQWTQGTLPDPAAPTGVGYFSGVSTGYMPNYGWVAA